MKKIFCVLLIGDSGAAVLGAFPTAEIAESARLHMEKKAPMFRFTVCATQIFQTLEEAIDMS